MRYLLLICIVFSFLSQTYARPCKYLKLRYRGKCRYFYSVRKIRRKEMRYILRSKSKVMKRRTQVAKEIDRQLSVLEKLKKKRAKELHMRYAALLIEELYILGDFETALSKAGALSKMTCTCPQDPKVAALHFQLKSFKKFYDNIQKGIEVQQCDLILNSIEPLKQIAPEISRGKPREIRDLKQYYLKGYECKAAYFEKNDELIKADEVYKESRKYDPRGKIARRWKKRKEKLSKKLISKAKVSKSFNPQKAIEYLRMVMKLFTYDHPLHKEADKELREIQKNR